MWRHWTSTTPHGRDPSDARVDLEGRATPRRVPPRRVAPRRWSRFLPHRGLRPPGAGRRSPAGRQPPPTTGRPRTAPIRTGAAGALVAVAGALNRIPPALQRRTSLPDLPQVLRAQRRTGGERRARLPAAGRALRPPRRNGSTFEQIRADEERHRARSGSSRRCSPPTTGSSRRVERSDHRVVRDQPLVHSRGASRTGRTPTGRTGASPPGSRSRLGAGKTETTRSRSLEDCSGPGRARGHRRAGPAGLH